MVGAIILFLWLFMIPTLVGNIAAAGVDKKEKNLPFLWITGQMLLWAVFQLIAVPLVLTGKPFSTHFKEAISRENPLWTVVTLYLAAAVVLAAAGILFSCRRLRKRKMAFKVIRGFDNKGKWYCILWLFFWLLLIFQMVQAVRMTYADGDDAFYVAVATIAEESNYMYQKLPYTGGTTGLDGRHGLAPFPIWIAFLARISGVPVVTTAHVAVPLALIPMTYGIYYLIGRKICARRNEKLPLFLVLTEILVLFGDYSFYSVENFMIARSRQGKAALGSIIIPMMFFLFLIILERIQENKKVELIWWMLLTAVIMSGCLCSTLGAMLLCMLTGVVGICASVVYRRMKLLVPMALCCIPAVVYAVLYLLLE
ncbi:MAG: hypothetical protein IJZ34_00360 [Lachnospiraceae bacterium]|nr:hypothetical protein [Lachnospiraceae bacterium]